MSEAPVQSTKTFNIHTATTRTMDTILQFYFTTGLIWAMFWTVKFSLTGFQKLALRKPS